MKLSDAEISEIRKKYSHYGNYESEDPDAPIDPLSYVDSNGDSLLHIASRLGDIQTVELLLKGGMDVNLIGDMGNTPLHYAKNAEVATLLMAHGASRDIYNEFGKQPLP
jgi:ankyrin repeat protein